jgi:hypothetical protein
MPWKGALLAIAEFVGGLFAVRVALPLESLILLAVGFALALMGILGMMRNAPPPAERRYQGLNLQDR